MGVSSSTLADYNGLIYVVIIRNSRRRCMLQFNIVFSFLIVHFVVFRQGFNVDHNDDDDDGDVKKSALYFHWRAHFAAASVQFASHLVQINFLV